MPTLEISIAPDGKVSSKVNGVKGRKCTEIDDFLEELGKTTTTKTREFYEEREKVVLLRPGQQG